MHEPAVTLTDYLLAAECTAFAWLVIGRNGGALGRWFALFFGSVALAAAAGGTVHGFFPESDTPGHRILWLTTLAAIGATALAAWSIGARLGFSGRVAQAIIVVAAAEYFVYCLIVLSVSSDFRVAIVDYLPAVLFLLAVLALRYSRTRDPAVLSGVAGFVVMLIAAGLQQQRIGVHPVHLDHNAFYHLLQAAAFALVFWCAWRLVGDRTTREVTYANAT